MEYNLIYSNRWINENSLAADFAILLVRYYLSGNFRTIKKEEIDSLESCIEEENHERFDQVYSVETKFHRRSKSSVSKNLSNEKFMEIPDTGYEPHKYKICTSSQQKNPVKACPIILYSQEQGCIPTRPITSKTGYKCELCDIALLDFQCIKNHIKNHTDQKNCKCHLCYRAFRLRKIHINQKKYECDICSKVLVAFQNLKRHMQYHTNETKRTCAVCNEVFKRFRSLRRHMPLNEEGNKCECDVCCKVLSSLCSLKSHMKNNKYKCEVCSKGTATKLDLKRHHMQFHKYPKTYKCDLCNRAFKSNAYLKRHRQIHTN